MSFYGRHKVYLIFWPWDYQPFTVTSDMIQLNVSKGADSGSTCNIDLMPRNVPRSVSGDRIIERDESRTYMDVLQPNDWVFAFVNPQDGLENVEPMFFGFIDRVHYSKAIDESGAVVYGISVAASGWEKAFENTTVLSQPYLARNGINLPNLFALTEALRTPDIPADTTATPDISLFQSLLPDFIAYLIRLFLRAETDADDTVSEDTEPRESAIEEASETEESSNVPIQIPPIIGQYEIPNEGLSLYEFIRLRFENVQQRTYIEQSMFLNQQQKSLSQMIDTVSNQVLNTIIYDFRRISNDGLSDLNSSNEGMFGFEPALDSDILGGFDPESVDLVIQAATEALPILGEMLDDVAPYMIMRIRPLFKDELARLDGPTIDESEIIQSDLGVADSDLHNLTLIETPGLHNNSPARVVSGFPGFNEYRTETLESIKRHGFRYYEDSTNAWPSQASAAHPTPELTREWDIRLQRAGLDNVKTWNGSIVIPKFYRNLFLGGKVIINHIAHPGVFTNAVSRIYYVDGIDYSYTAATGAFITSVSLVRGYLLDD